MTGLRPRLTDGSREKVRGFLAKHAADPDALKSVQLKQVRGGEEMDIATTDASEHDLLAWVEAEARDASARSPSGFFILRVAKRKRGRPSHMRFELSAVADASGTVHALQTQNAELHRFQLELLREQHVTMRISNERAAADAAAERDRAAILADMLAQVRRAATPTGEPGDTSDAVRIQQLQTANKALGLLEQYIATRNGRPTDNPLLPTSVAPPVVAALQEATPAADPIALPDTVDKSATTSELATAVRASFTHEQRKEFAAIAPEATAAYFADPDPTNALFALLSNAPAEKLPTLLGLLQPAQFGTLSRIQELATQ